MHDDKSGKTKPSCTENKRQSTYDTDLQLRGTNQAPTDTYLPSRISFSRRIKIKHFFGKKRRKTSHLCIVPERKKKEQFQATSSQIFCMVVGGKEARVLLDWKKLRTTEKPIL